MTYYFCNTVFVSPEGDKAIEQIRHKTIKGINVLSAMLEKMDANNEFSCLTSELARASKISSKSISNTVQLFEKLNIVTKTQTQTPHVYKYHINEDLFRKAR